VLYIDLGGVAALGAMFERLTPATDNSAATHRRGVGYAHWPGLVGGAQAASFEQLQP
jgi:hypothetical protein